ncbi:MAG: PilN domain-containing protein [Acidobacteria bacterium]|nr:PilN domain-containing protein [Acidobacteriota bacterium]
MIKVNLLKDQTAPVRKTFTAPAVSRTGLIYLVIFLLVAGATATWYFYVQHQLRASVEKRDKLRIEEARLQTLKREIEKYEKLKQLRQSRIDVIEKLKENQTGPVLLMNSVLQSIPRDGVLWLTSLTQKADRIKIVGYTEHTEVIPDFMSNLTASGIFASVDLESIESQKEASKFSLICMSLTKSQAE